MMLQEYCTQHPTFPAAIPSRHSMVSSRFGKLLLLLPAFRSMRHSSVRDLFFRQLIGDIPITRLLSDVMGTFWKKSKDRIFNCSTNLTTHPVNSSRLFRNVQFSVRRLRFSYTSIVLQFAWAFSNDYSDEHHPLAMLLWISSKVWTKEGEVLWFLYRRCRSNGEGMYSFIWIRNTQLSFSLNNSWSCFLFGDSSCCSLWFFLFSLRMVVCNLASSVFQLDIISSTADFENSAFEIEMYFIQKLVFQ